MDYSTVGDNILRNSVGKYFRIQITSLSYKSVFT